MPTSRKNKKITSKFLLLIAAVLFPLLAIFVFFTYRNASTDNRSQAAIASLITGEKWIHPNFHSDLGTYSWASAMKTGSYWDLILPEVDVVSFFMLTVHDNPENFLQPVIAKLKQHNTKIAVESFGSWKFSPCTSQRGEDSARVELSFIQPIYDNGGTVSYLSLDDPISRMIAGSQNQAGTCNFTLEESVREMIDYMKAVHRVHPEIQIGVIFNFPNWPYADGVSTQNSTYFEGATSELPNLDSVLEYMMAEVERSGEKVAFVHADSPYDYYRGQVPTPYLAAKTTNWSNRLLAFEEQVQQRGIPFGLVYNSHRGGDSSAALYFSDTLSYISEYDAAGGMPDNIILESWYSQPSTFLPAMQPCSFGHLTLAAFSTMSNLPSCNYRASETAVEKLPVYRINTSASYYYVAGAEADAQTWAQANNGTVEGVAFFTPKQHPLAVSVFSVKNANNNYLFTHSSEELRSATQSYGYQENSLGFFAFDQAHLDSKPVYRLNNQGRYLLTISKAESDEAVRSYGYALEGIAFYAFE